ncbi:hypothetical protein JNB88_18270 [Rhizobium cauense]|nr:hypothetical protein [Rhizobium cauense]
MKRYFQKLALGNCDEVVGVLATVTIPTASRLKQSPAHSVVAAPDDGRCKVEHPTGDMEVFLDTAEDSSIRGAGTIRTARKLFDERVLGQPLSIRGRKL